MNIKQQLEQVIAEMEDALIPVGRAEMTDFYSRLSAIVEQMGAEPVGDKCPICNGIGKVGIPGQICELCKGTGRSPLAAPQVPDGMVLVPKDPTDKMLMCFGHEWITGEAYDCYKAMIAAAKEEGSAS